TLGKGSVLKFLVGQSAPHTESAHPALAAVSLFFINQDKEFLPRRGLRFSKVDAPDDRVFLSVIGGTENFRRFPLLLQEREQLVALLRRPSQGGRGLLVRLANHSEFQGRGVDFLVDLPRAAAKRAATGEKK